MEMNAREYKFGIKWAQNTKNEWHCEQISIKADTPEDLVKAQNEAIEVMKNGRQSLI